MSDDNPGLDRAIFRCAFCDHVTHTYSCDIPDCGCRNGVFSGLVADGVTVPLPVVGWFIVDALGRLPDPEWAAAHDDPESCCAICCGPCAGLRQLQTTGQLDPLIRAHAKQRGMKLDGWTWWNTEGDCVDEAYLDERINDAKCWNLDSHPALLAESADD